MGDSDKLKFSVVHFKSDDAVETIPNSWIFEEDRVTYCRFPPSKIVTKPKIQKLFSNPYSHPSDDWEVHEIKKVVKSYKTFQRADKRAKRYVVNSDEDSTETEAPTRKRQKTKQTTNPVQITCPPIGLESLDQYLPHNGTVTLPLLKPIQASTQFKEPDTIQDDINEPGMSHSEPFSEEFQTGPCVDGKRSTLAAEGELPTYMGGKDSITLLTLQKEQRKFQEETVLKLVTLESGINEIKLLLLKLLANQQTRETTADSDSYPLLPLTSCEDLEAIENWLSQTNHEEKLAKALSKIGGQKISSSVYNILSHVISPSFAKEIRLTSASGKLAFGPTKLANVVRESVRVSSSESVSNSIIDQYIGRWFRNSNDRKGGRKLRKQKKYGNPSNNEETETTPKLTLNAQ